MCVLVCVCVCAAFARVCVCVCVCAFRALLTGTRFQIGLLVKRNLCGCIQSFSQRRNTGHMFEGDSNCEVLRLNGLCSCNDMVNTRTARRLFLKRIPCFSCAYSPLSLCTRTDVMHTQVHSVFSSALTEMPPR